MTHGSPPTRSGVGWLSAHAGALLGFLALVQLILHPLVSGGSLRTWAAYWVYTAVAVVLPGTFVAGRLLRWRADGVTWIGIGWALGHALELASLLIARQLGLSLLFLGWVPVAWLAGWLSRSSWEARLEPLRSPRTTATALAILFVSASATFFVLGVPEISTAPPYRSDPWFHVNNAHEFRDHSPVQDPRLAGEPLVYHLFGYGAPAAASLATGEPLAALLTRFSGTSSVCLLALGLFNVGRAVGHGSVLAGALSALLVLVPLEPWRLFHERLVFGTTDQLYGVYVSTTTLAGHAFLAPLLLLVLWLQRGAGGRPGWAIGLLAFAGAGSKAMLGPVVLAGALGLAGWQILTARRFDRRVLHLPVLLAAGVLPALLPLLVSEGSYASSVRWVVAEYAASTPAFETLVRWGLPAWSAGGLWIVGFESLLLAGGLLSLRGRSRSDADGPYTVFVWMCWIAAVVAGLALGLQGGSQLFFLYYGNHALAGLAGAGLAAVPIRQLARAAGGAIALWLASQLAFGFPGSPFVTGSEVNPIWVRAEWWRSAVSDREHPELEPPVEDPLDYWRRASGDAYYWKRLALLPDVRDGLEWARRHLPADAVFAVNVDEAAPYAALSESRAFLETTVFHPRSHQRARSGIPDSYFEGRRQLIHDWRAHVPGAAVRLRSAGVTHLFVDSINGQGGELPDLPRPVFARPHFRIYELPAPPPGG